MLLLTVYTVTARSSLPFEEGELPPDVPLSGDTSASLVRHDEHGYRLLLRRRVAHGDLELVEISGWYRRSPDGTREDLPAVRIHSGISDSYVLVRDLLSAVSFLTNIPLHLSRPVQEDRLEPEDDADRELLERFGTHQPYHESSVQIQSRTFHTKVTAEQIDRLMS